MAAVGIGQHHAIVSDCRGDEQRPPVFRVISRESRRRTWMPGSRLSFGLGKLPQVWRSRVPLRMRDPYIGKGDVEREVLVDVTLRSPANVRY